MKKGITLFLTVLLVWSLAACGGTAETGAVSSVEESITTESVEAESAAPEAEPSDDLVEASASSEDSVMDDEETVFSQEEAAQPDVNDEAGEEAENTSEPITVTADYTAGEWNDAVHTYDGGEVNYSVYVPESFDGTTSLPLITFIPDATYSRSSLSELKGAQCPTAWITEENMREHPCFILIMEGSAQGADIDDTSTFSSQVVPIIDEVAAAYAADTNKLYLTGQSMGGIFDFVLNDKYPDKFAATVYVACQPGDEPYDDQYNSIIENRQYLNQTFVYIASAMDPKAPKGQASVMEALDEAGIEYGLLQDIDHEGGEVTEAAVSELLGQGYQQNVLQFTSVAGGNPPQEHMQSFQYAYNIQAIFEWLLNQSL